MIFTARQLEDLHRNGGGNGHVVLPYGARLTPLASDWLRAKKIRLGYGPDDMVKSANGEKVVKAVGAEVGGGGSVPAGSWLWWCDGPCGAGKAAAGAVAKEASLTAVEEPGDPKRLVAVIKRIGAEVRDGKAAGGVLMVAGGGPAVVLANRSPLLRAVIGTTLEALEGAINAVAANVLVIEYPRRTLPEIKNLVARFVKAKRNLSDELCKQMQEIAAEKCSPLPGKTGCGCGCSSKGGH
ncbi:MAG TPA: hypothetical protein VEA69_01125 [Tepidisphaeraceae bacterium]|nr:hypothetical protein [Tepidisphaeraceae bacterium]